MPHPPQPVIWMAETRKLLLRAYALLEGDYDVRVLGRERTLGGVGSLNTDEGVLALLRAAAVLTRAATELLEGEALAIADEVGLELKLDDDKPQAPLPENPTPNEVDDEAREESSSPTSTEDGTDGQHIQQGTEEPTDVEDDPAAQAEAIKDYFAGIKKNETGRLSWRERQKLERGA